MDKQYTLDEEQESFNIQRKELLSEHKGEWVLFKNQKVVGFFSSAEAAYEEGIERFGNDVVFLVDRIREDSPFSVSASYELGVMFAS